MRIYRPPAGETWTDETAGGEIETVGDIRIRYGLNPGDDLAAVIEEGFESFPQPVQVYGYPVDAPKYPAIIVTPDNPAQAVRSMGGAGERVVEWRYRVLCCVPRGNPRDMWPLLYDIRQQLTSIAFASPGRNNHDVYIWTEAEEPTQDEVNAQESWCQPVLVMAKVSE